MADARQASRGLDAAPPGEKDSFQNLLQTFQDPDFERIMAGMSRDRGDGDLDGVRRVCEGLACDLERAVENDDPGFTDMLDGILLDRTVLHEDPEKVGGFRKEDLLHEALQSLVTELETHLQATWKPTTDLEDLEERERYERQLGSYKRVLQIIPLHCESGRSAEEKDLKLAQRLLMEVHDYGALPPEVIAKLSGDAAAGGGAKKSFSEALASADETGQASDRAVMELLADLAEDPAALRKVLEKMSQDLAEPGED